MRTIVLYPALLLGLWSIAQPTPAFYWPFDEGSGTTVHDVAGGTTGHLQGNTTWIADGAHAGHALRFAGGGARIDAGPCDITDPPSDAITLACWFRPEMAGGGERTLIAKTLGAADDQHIWSLSMINSMGGRFRISAAGTTHTLDIPNMNLFLNAWYHLCGIYDGTEMRLYVNGGLAASAPAAGLIGAHPEAPTTMGDITDGSKPFIGILDDVRVYGQALSQQEVIDLVLGELSTGVPEADVRLVDRRIQVMDATKWSTLRIIDATGRTLRATRLPSSPATIDVADLPSGVYLVCLQGNAGTRTRTVVVP